MARRVYVLAAEVIAALSWGSTPAAAAQPATHYMINSSAVNLRTDPSMDADVQFRLPFGTRCELVERQGSWKKIQLVTKEPLSGWVRWQYVEEVRFTPKYWDERWMELAQAPEKGIRRPDSLDDIPCDPVDEPCVEDYRNRYTIERRNALERWIFWTEDAPVEARTELWAILGGERTPYADTPVEILNQSPFYGIPRAAYQGARRTYRVDEESPRDTQARCAPRPKIKPSFFQELPERFASSRGSEHGGIIDFQGTNGRAELMKILDVYYADENPLQFETVDRYTAEERIPFATYDVKSGTLERNAGRPVYVPSRNMFLISDLEKESPDQRDVIVFFSWIEVYLDQICQAKKVERLEKVKMVGQGGEACNKRVAYDTTALDFDGDHVADVVLVSSSLGGNCGFKRHDTWLNAGGAWHGYVNESETWCDHE